MQVRSKQSDIQFLESNSILLQIRLDSLDGQYAEMRKDIGLYQNIVKTQEEIITDLKIFTNKNCGTRFDIDTEVPYEHFYLDNESIPGPSTNIQI